MTLGGMLAGASPGEGALLLLLDSGLKSLALLAVAAGLALALRGAAPWLRAAVWALSLAGALLLPALSPLMPALAVPALAAPVSDGGPPSTERAEAPRAAPSPIPESASGGAARGGDSTGSAPALRPPSPRRTAVAAADVPPAPAPAPREWTAYVLPAWLAGLLGVAFWHAAGLARARALARRAAPPGVGRWSREAEEARRASGVDTGVRLLLSREARTPMTWGWRRPVILLPLAARGWGAERRRVVLLHEMAHIRRGDWVVRMLAAAACAAYWFNPLAWIAARRLAVEQELACDEAVLAHGARPSAYAGHLLAIARAAAPRLRTPLPALEMARRSQMEGRLMSILDDSRRGRRRRIVMLPSVLLTVGLVPAVAAVHPWINGSGAGGTFAMQSAGPASAAASGAAVDTGELERVLGELAELESRLEPFEAELDGIAAEMEPVAEELAGLEREATRPFEAEQGAIEAELEPFAALAEAIEAELEPFAARLEAIAAEMAPFEFRLDGFDPDLEPLELSLEALELEMEPVRLALESVALEIEPLEEELERLAEEIAAGGEPGSAGAEIRSRRMAELRELLQPLRERMSSLHRELRPLHQRMESIHREMAPVYERMGSLHEELRPLREQMEAVHREMRPVIERMGEVHLQMEPLHQRMEETHRSLEPIHERMSAYNERMRPLQERMAEVHRRMEPLFEELGRRRSEVETELRATFERILRRELGAAAPGGDFAAAAVRVGEAVDIRVEDDRMRVRSSPAELREVLTATLGGAAREGADFAAAVERAVRAIGDLEVPVER